MKKTYISLVMTIASVTSTNLHTMQAQRPEVYQIIDELTDKTPIHWPTIFNFISSLKGTIGINDYRSTAWNDTLLFMAVNDGNFIAAKTLLEKYHANPNIPGRNNVTVLMIACRNNDITMVKLLLHHKANPSLKNLEGSTAFDYCSNEKIRTLLSQ